MWGQTTRYVPESAGSPGYATINAAIAASVNGDIIEVAAGTYSENVIITKNLSLIGAGASSTIIDGLNTGSGLGAIHLNPGRNGVLIQGFHIKGLDGPMGLEKSGIYLQGAQTNITIKENTIEARGDAALMGEYNAANDGIIITKNTFTGQTFTGTTPATGGQYTVENVARQAIVFGGSTGTTNTQNFTFTNNIISTISGTSTRGNTLVTLDLVGTNTISGNYFTGTAYTQALRLRGSGAYSVNNNSFTGSFSKAIEGTTSTNIDATCNWWGQITGPKKTFPSQISGAMITSTWLISGDLDNPICAGGQPVQIFRGGVLIDGYSTIQPAVAAAVNGDEIRIANGTYYITSTLHLNKELTIIGQSEAGVIINTTGTGAGWGINPNKSNTSLSNFTIVPNGVDGGYPIHVAENVTPGTVISNITLSHITINGAYRTAFDFNGVDNLNISYLTAKNAGRGNGIQVSGCTNVTASNLTTSGNVWGGFAVYVSTYVGRGSSNVNIDGTTSSFGEGNDIYVQNESGFVNSNVTVTGYDYLVQNPGNVGYTFIKKDKTIAYSFAAALTNPQNSSVKKISTGEFWVGSTLKIQAAVDAAENGNVVNVDAGTYLEMVTITKSITLLGAQAGVDVRGGTRTEGSATESIIIGSTALQNCILVKGASSSEKLLNVVIDGFELKNANYANIQFNNTDGAILRNTFSHHNITNEGIKGGGNINTLIQKCISHNNVGAGIDITSDNLVIEDCEFFDNDDQGCYVQSSNNATIRRVKSYGNLGTLGDWHQGGIHTYNCNGTTITDVESFNNKGFGINIYKENSGTASTYSSTINGTCKVYNNTINTAPSSIAPGDGVYIYLSSNVSVTGLDSYNNTRSGIFIGTTGVYGDLGPTAPNVCQNNNITNCRIYDNGTSAIAFMGVGTSNCSATGNSLLSSSLSLYNNSGNIVNASCNWWGATNYSAILPKVSGNVNFLNFLTSSDLTSSCNGVGPVVNLTTGQSYMKIQPAVDAANPGDLIKVPSGTYTEDVNTTGKSGVKFSIGASPGCVTIDGNLTLTSLDTWIVEMLGATACTQFDKATVTGNLDAGGAKLIVMVDPDFVPAVNSTFEIFAVTGSITGTFTPVPVTSGKYRFDVQVAANAVNLVTLQPLAVDIALYEVGCAGFKVVLRPTENLDENLSNLQFTIKYPASVELTNIISPLGMITGTPLAPSGGFKFVTYVIAPLASAGWVAGTEYTVLTFSHNQLGTGTGNLVVLPNAEANISTSFYAEYKGMDVTGVNYANALTASLDGCPVHNETKDLWYYKIQPAIDEAASADVVRAYNVPFNGGIYAENLVIDKALTLVGPNDLISPNGGARVPEVVIIPAVTLDYQITVTASNVTIKGLTIDGDNPAITTGYIGTNGADMDNYIGIAQETNNVNNLVIQNNIIKNQFYFAIELYGGSTSAPATSGNLIDNNLIKDLGYYNGGTTNYAKWGGGVLLYNNQYTRVTNNVMTNVRLGIQTGNFSRANIGTADYQVIDNNTIEARRLGIFHNLHYGPTSPYTISNNTITALANTEEVSWKGILLSSLSVNSLGIDNMIDGAGVTTVPTIGYEIWNVKNITPANITGGIVQNVERGVFANNFEGYNSNGTDGASVVVTGMTIMPKVTGFGIYGLDSPGYNGTADALINITASNNKIIGGAEAINLAETRPNKVSATLENNSITGYTQAVNSTVANTISATCNWWGTANLSAIASKITNANVIYSPYLSNNTELAVKLYPYGFDPAGLCETVLPLKVWLQGPYSTGTHEMATGLNGQLPSNQPFSVSPWGYQGIEVLPSPLSADVVDWVLVEARSNETDAVERAAGLLYKNGLVNVAMDKLVQTGNYHFVVYHRNHIPVMSAQLIPLAAFPSPLDLTVEANLYGNANSIPNKPAVELETGVMGMIAGDVTRNGVLQYSGPGNDRGPILARINAGVVGATPNSVLSNGYWFEDVLMNNDVKYNGSENDRSPIINNLGILTGTTYLNAVYTSPVPMVDVSGIQQAPAFRNKPVSIDIDAKGIALTTNEVIRDGVIDNIQFTLAWRTGNTVAEKAIMNSKSDFMLMPQGKPVNIDGVSHQVFVSIYPTALPKAWTMNETVNVMTFDNNVLPGTIWIADNDFTATNNAMYYVSVWGEDHTGEIIAKIPTGNNTIFGTEEIKVYPIPSNSGKVYVELSASVSNNMQLSVYDVSGKVLQHTKMATAGNIITIDVSNLVSGVYLIRVVDNNVTYNSRFIVNN